MPSLKFLSATVLLAITFPLCVKAQEIEFHEIRVYSACATDRPYGVNVNYVNNDTAHPGGTILGPAQINLESPNGIQYRYSALYNITGPINNSYLNFTYNFEISENNEAQRVIDYAEIDLSSQNGHVSTGLIAMYWADGYTSSQGRLSAMIEFDKKTQDDGCDSTACTTYAGSGCGVNINECTNTQIINVGWTVLLCDWPNKPYVPVYSR